LAVIPRGYSSDRPPPCGRPRQLVAVGAELILDADARLLPALALLTASDARELFAAADADASGRLDAAEAGAMARRLRRTTRNGGGNQVQSDAAVLAAMAAGGGGGLVQADVLRLAASAAAAYSSPILTSLLRLFVVTDDGGGGPAQLKAAQPLGRLRVFYPWRMKHLHTKNGVEMFYSPYQKYGAASEWLGGPWSGWRRWATRPSPRRPGRTTAACLAWATPSF
jgi:hypothetical protein